MISEIRDELGPVDVVVVNATPAQPQKPIEDYGWDFYQSMLDYFIKSPYLLTRAVLPHMKQQRWGPDYTAPRGLGDSQPHVRSRVDHDMRHTIAN